MGDNPLERIIEDALITANIKYVCDRERNSPAQLDFYLPDSNLHIEVKAYHTERVEAQMARVENVIVIQGKAAALWFAAMVRAAGNPST